MRLVGAPWQVAESIRTGGVGTRAVTFSASESGTLVYVSRDVEEMQRRLVWFDRSGKELRQLDGRDPVETTTAGALSPDGSRLAVDRRGSIWILDVERGGLTRFGTPGEFSPFGRRRAIASCFNLELIAESTVSRNEL
jgi:sugar lactone lactonase YvrE